MIGDACTGCSACLNSCHKQAITLIPNGEGFFYPSVSQSNCTNCKLCIDRCPILKPKQNLNFSNPEVYAAWNKDEKIRILSTSGGIFSALAQMFIQKGGSVVGARYEADFTVSHCIIDKAEDIALLRQSKYVQSNLDNIFKKIETKLFAGEKILFCGTPCQSAGLQSFLKKKYDNLYICDFICRGVISPKVYQKFLNDTARKYDSSLKNVQFKNKDYGWNFFSTKLEFENGKIYQKDREKDFYMKGYLKYNLYLRPSCHNCQFKSLPRVSDLSLGDFWGIGNYQKELDSNKGTSVILINSSKGKELFSWIEDSVYFSKRSISEVFAGNSCLLYSAPEGEYRAYFFEQMDKMAFDKLIEKIESKAQHIVLKDRLAKIIHRIIKNRKKRRKKKYV